MHRLRLACLAATLSFISCSSSENKPGTAVAGSGGSGGTSSVGGAAAGAQAGGSSSGLAGMAGFAGAEVGGSGGAASGGATNGGAANGGGSAAGLGGGGASGGMSMAGPPFGHPDPNVAAPVYDGFTLWLVEDFTQPLDLLHDPIWAYSDGGFSTHRFTRDAITFEPGKMVVTLSDTAVPASCSFSNTGVVPPQMRESGELRTKYNWFRYGRYEARVKAPSVQPGNTDINGNYIASLFTYRQPACQEWREIDLEVTGDAPGRLSTNLITADGDCNFSPDKEQPQVFDLPGSFRTDFQTIGFEWLPGSIKFYYLGADDQPVVLRELTGAKVPTLSAKIMANLWMFDDSFAFGGPLGENNQLPLRAEYDFIRFYRWNQDMDYPCADMSTSCLAAQDVDLSSNNACDGVPLTGDLAACKQCGMTLRMACTDACVP